MKIGIGILIFSIFLVMIPAQSSASTNVESDYKTIDYEIIFHSSWKECTDRNLQALSFYNSLTMEYLTLNKLNIGNVNLKCLSVKDEMLVSDINPNNELTILILDYLKSIDFVIESGNYGVSFSAPHDGIYSNFIITNSATIQIGNSRTAWTLSHELMHFIITYKGFDYNYHFDYVHVMQDRWNDCLNKNTCSEIWTTLLISDTLYRVMWPMMEQDPKPVPEPTCPSGYELKSGVCAISEQPTTPEYSPVQPTKPYMSDAQMAQESSWKQYYETYDKLNSKQIEVYSLYFESSDAQNRLQKAKNTINQVEIDLETIREYLLVGNQWFIQESYETAFFVYENAKIDTSNILYKISGIGTDINSAKFFEEQYQESIRPKQPTHEPSVFKKTKTEIQVMFPTKPFTVYEGEILEFTGKLFQKTVDGGFVRLSGVEVKVIDTVPDQTGGYPVLGTDITDKDGRYEIIWRATQHPAKLNPYFGIWDPIVRFDGNSNFEPVELKLTQFDVELTSVAKPEPIITPIQPSKDTSGDKVEHLWITIDVIGNEYGKDTFEPFENVELVVKVLDDQNGNPVSNIDVRIVDKFSHLKPGTIIATGTTNSQGIVKAPWIVQNNPNKITDTGSSWFFEVELTEFIGNNMRGIWISVNDPSFASKAKQPEKDRLTQMKENRLKEVKELENKALSLEQTLTGIIYKNKVAQEKIDEAWTGLRIIKVDTDFMNDQINKGNNALDKNDLDNANNYFSRQGPSINLIETYLEKIPKLIEDAKAIDVEKPKEKFCFLWWCW